VSIAGRGRAPRLVDTTTRADGSFELHITGKQGDVVNVFLAGPGIAADAALLRLSRNPWTLRVSRSGGRLGIVLPKRQGVGAIGSLVLLRQDGAALSFSAFAHGGLVASSSRDGTIVTINDLAAGPWRLVSTASPTARRAVLAGAGMALPAAGEITVAAGSAARVTLGQQR
jgi:hypothetical protein